MLPAPFPTALGSLGKTLAFLRMVLVEVTCGIDTVFRNVIVVVGKPIDCFAANVYVRLSEQE